MTGLPGGWRVRRLRELLAEPLANGRSVKDRAGGFPVLRLTAMTAAGIDLRKSKEGDWTADEAKRFLVKQGDVLIVRGNGSLKLVGRAGLVGPVDQPVAYPDTLIRVRPDLKQIDARYLSLAWSSDVVRRQIESMARTTAGIYKVNQRGLEEVEVPFPPLDEQLRIVEILEGHLSRLDAATANLRTASRRAAALKKSILLDSVPDVSAYPAEWKSVTVADAGKIELGRQRHPDWHTGPNMRPYLRVANVFEDRIDTSDVMEMHWPEETFERFKLRPGDVLLNEGQSPEWLGRPAIYRGEPAETAFTNSLMRFKAYDGVLPEFALLVFRRHMHAGRFTRESRITTNIAHLSATRLKKVEFPIPPLEVQQQIVAQTDESLTAVGRLTRAVDAGRKREKALRRMLLAAAFSGRLTGRSLNLDSVEHQALKMEPEVVLAGRQEEALLW